ncbi:clone ZZD536 mRNA sequence-like protein [Theileria orientalis strain Shintoku]|uniref:Clone ZZD536 mRNA sequence-like protein n=1 Tax=Theileria orientalis strain Shintoku TaxID=869250 RepID=J4DQ82_THEOR|nr:clone ZZD536 mRNA sequence-like protein [Theileria orientalis strain Shintoku]BAM41999.1 clone ZZD536 mRNA sequence-like protein [Theileria orientalis strain Shintoku]|eukprot:XP_009692300.1 clone ZZD536 mRNA sequence-like protein [Theileria orientalis strain Shintoku]
MGSAISKTIKKTKVTRNIGDYLNTSGLPPVHTEVFTSHISPVTRIPVCRCWKSSKFPLCDNSHQKLEKMGIDCGPAMLEIRKRF